jgi:SAM-dependent methyltransferase
MMPVFLRQLYYRQRRLIRGFTSTYLRKAGHPYRAEQWWDNTFYEETVSDANTISAGRKVLPALYHYRSVETTVLGALIRRGHDPHGNRVLDLGSGAGHWIDFYLGLGAKECLGLEISSKAAGHLHFKYAGDGRVRVARGDLLNSLRDISDSFELVNAVGIMFHIVEDNEWNEAIGLIGRRLVDGGVFVASGHFGLIGGLNVQIDPAGNINKRLRSRFQWGRVLGQAGFIGHSLHRNWAYLRVPEGLPESHVLLAWK